MVRHFTVLLVEDSPDFAFLLQEAFKELQSKNNLISVRDEIELYRYLQSEGEFSERAIPDLILLDLNLPGKGGQEILKELKSSDQFGAIPVIILTGSTNPAEIDQSYDSGANCFLTRPVNFNDLISLVSILEKFWFSMVKLPSH